MLTGHGLNEDFAPGPWVTLRELFVPGFTRFILLPRIFDFGEKNAAGLYERARFGLLCFCLPPKAPPSGEELLAPTFSQSAHCSGVDAQALTALYPRIPNNQKRFVFKLLDRQAFHPHDLQPLPLLSSIYNYLYPRVFYQHLHLHQDRKGGERNCLNRWEAAPRDTCISDNICKKLGHFNLFIHNYNKIEACNIEVE